MIITKIEKQKKNNDRSSVFLDDKFAFGIDNFDLYNLKIKVGTDISKERLQEIKETILFSSAKEYAVKLVSRYSYTKKGIWEKLKKQEYDDEIIEKTIVFLKNYKFIDDFDYAKRFINDSLKFKHWGVKKIKYELKQRGIEESTIYDALAEFDTDTLELEGILPIAKKKLAGDFEYKNIIKVKKHLESKGFSYDLIDSTINILINKEGK